MGLWQATYGDLKAAGIEVTAEQREVVEKGGEVLIIESLPAPSASSCQCGQPHPAYDAKGDVMMVASIMEAFPPLETAHERFARPAGVVTMADLVNEAHHDHWRFWPSYVGRVDVAIDAMEWWTQDEMPIVRRVWSGWPVTMIGSHTARAIVNACNAVVEATPYHYVERMAYYLDEEGAIVDENLDAAWDADVIEARECFRKEGWWDEETGEPGRGFSEDLAYPPMNEYLSQADHDVWQRLLITSRQNAVRAARMIKRGERNLYQHKESEFDPWF